VDRYGRIAERVAVSRGNEAEMEFDDLLSLVAGSVESFALGVGDFTESEYREDGTPSSELERAMSRLREAEDVAAISLGNARLEKSVSEALRALEGLMRQANKSERQFLTSLDQYKKYAKIAEKVAKNLTGQLERLNHGTLR